MSLARRHLLPPQTTALERAVDQSLPAWDTLASAGEPTATRANAQYQPWLAAQWQIAQFERYFPSADALLTNAMPWLFERGSAASVRRALTWLGYGPVTIEEDGAYLHIDPGSLLSDGEFAAIAHVVRASLPVHMRFYRIHHGHDLRPLRLDHGPALDAALLDDDSGGWIAIDGDDPLKVSQGSTQLTTHSGHTLAPQQSSQTQHRVSVLTYHDRLILDAWVLDSELLVDASLGLTERRTTTTTAPVPGQPIVSPAIALSAACTWLADPAQAVATQTTGDASNVAIDMYRTWTGTWDAQPWRPFFETKTTEEL